MRPVLLASLVLTHLIGGCGDPQPSMTDASTTDSSPSDTSMPDAAVDAVLADCPAGTLCLNLNKVVSTATIPNGRIVVVFYQLNDDLAPEPLPVAALDRPFVGSSTRVELSLADIALPTPLDDYQLCPRTCTDLTMVQCDCMVAEAKVALAFVFLMVDADMSGAIESDEIVDEDNVYGVGYMQIGAAPSAYPNPQMLQFLLPAGIANGVAAYEIIEAGTFDDLGIPPPGTVFLMDVCVPGDASCNQVRFPNLT